MPKINPLILAPEKVTKIDKEAMASIHGISKPEMSMVTISELESKAHSFFDFSTEELGFYTYKGKRIPIIFPR